VTGSVPVRQLVKNVGRTWEIRSFFGKKTCGVWRVRATTFAQRIADVHYLEMEQIIDCERDLKDIVTI
jgi:hypothetical protein